MYSFGGQTVHFKRSGCSTENGQGVFPWRYIQEELETAATSCGAAITGVPKSRIIADRLSEYVVEIADLKASIDNNMKRCFYELNKLTMYINSLDDSRLRMILAFRYINGHSWKRIALSIGGGNTEKGVQMIVKRFLEENCEI